MLLTRFLLTGRSHTTRGSASPHHLFEGDAAPKTLCMSPQLPAIPGRLWPKSCIYQLPFPT